MIFSINTIFGRLLAGGVLCLAMSILSGCSDNSLTPISTDGKGALSLGVAFDSKTMEGELTKALTKADVDYKVTIRDADNRRIRLWSSASEVPEKIWLLSGIYKIEVEAGTDTAAAFDSPYYVGSEDITIEPDMVTQHEVICTLANAKVTVKYSDKIKDNFATYQTKVGPSENSLTFGDESQVGFFKTVAGVGATELLWNLAITNSAGITFTENGSFTAEPKKHYILEFDITTTGETEGGMTFLTNVTVNEDVAQVDDNITIPIKRLPEITGVGYDIALDYYITDGNQPVVKVNLRGTPKIDSVGFAHDCAYFTTRGIPDAFDLFGADVMGDVAKNQLNASGLTWTMADDGVNMEVSFTELIKNLPDATYHFEFGVKDTSGKRASKTLTLLIVNSGV